jgi:membrane protease YdiL (CAAX protease family)
MSVLLVLLAFAGAQGGETSGDEVPVFFSYELAIGGLVFYAILAGTAWLVAARAYGTAREALGLRSFPPGYVWAALGVVVGSLVLSVALEPLLHAGEEQGLLPDDWVHGRTPAFVLNAFVVGLVGPFSEELFYRGLGVRALGFAGAATAIVGTSLVFALSHGLFVAIPALGAFALGLGWLRWRTQSVWPGVIAHAAYNTVGVLVTLAVLLG